MSKGASRIPRIGQEIGRVQPGGIVGMTLWLQQLLKGFGRNPEDSVFTLTLGPSPAQYTNTTDYDQDVYVTGASNTDFGRNGMPMMSIGADGIFRLNPGDMLEITYGSPPTVSIIPR